MSAERHRTHGALATASRVRLLDVLRASEHAMDARELAAASGLHVSTVRFHLDVLGEVGLVRSQTALPRTRGRPRLLYTPASAGESTNLRGSATEPGYELLAMLLAAHWAHTPAERARQAEQAGWSAAKARGFSARIGPDRTAAQAVSEVSGLFAELGFEPELAQNGEDVELRLHACPFRAVAQEYPEVVCSLHLGLLRGSLVELGAPVTVRSLQPFVQPHLCVAHIGPATESPPSSEGA